MLAGTPLLAAAAKDAPGVRVRLLSGFELTGNGEPVSLPLSAQRLVALLALRNRPLLRPYVAGTLWLDSSEERSAASLRSALWRLHRPGYRVVNANGSTLHLAEDVRVDVHEAEALARTLLENRNEVEDRAPLDTLAAELLPD